MKGERRNQYPGKCERCGGRVAPGAGWMQREDRGGTWVTVIEHADACPEESEAPNAPAWAVPAKGRTAAGNEASGYGIVRSGAMPQDDAVPVCDQSRAIVARGGR